jgi:hypothetical protein
VARRGHSHLVDEETNGNEENLDRIKAAFGIIDEDGNTVMCSWIRIILIICC